MNRSRATLDRWRKDKGLPVYSVSDSPGSAVFAYEDELEEWLKTGRGPTQSAAPSGASPGRLFTTPRAMIVGVLVVLAILGALAFLVKMSRESSHPWPLLPTAWMGNSHQTHVAAASQSIPDPTTRQSYMRARADWGKRTPEGLDAALHELEFVTRRQPKYADGYSALADVYLLMPEFDVMPQPTAFARAEFEAGKALAIDPGNVGGNRALGFIAYWSRRNNAEARRHFLLALKNDPDNPQTLLWYGNALMNNGEAGAGLAMLDKAHHLDPDSAPIEADLAYAKWSVGSDPDAAANTLESVEVRAPLLATPPSYLAQIAYSRHEWPNYLKHAERAAQLHGDRALIALIASQQAAFQQGGGRGLLSAISAVGLNSIVRFHFLEGTLVQATAAADLNQFDRLSDLLAQAEAKGEIWRTMPWLEATFRTARKSPKVAAQLDRLFATDLSRGRLAP